jgi:hypothetical protein
MLVESWGQLDEFRMVRDRERRILETKEAGVVNWEVLTECAGRAGCTLGERTRSVR